MKASSPEIASRPASSSNSFRPRASVSRKRSSSSRTTFSISACVRLQLRVGVTHLPGDDAAEPVDAFEPDSLAVLDGAPDDAAADVAPALVGGRDTVGDQERHRAAVVGKHAVGLRGDRIVAVCHP